MTICCWTMCQTADSREILKQKITRNVHDARKCRQQLFNEQSEINVLYINCVSIIVCPDKLLCLLHLSSAVTIKFQLPRNYREHAQYEKMHKICKLCCFLQNLCETVLYRNSIFFSASKSSLRMRKTPHFLALITNMNK